jgi:hypothetical protein
MPIELPMRKIIFPFALALTVTLTFFGRSTPAQAAGDSLSLFGVAYHMFSGADDKSLTGSTGYVLQFSAERKGKMVRPVYSADIMYASGTAALGTDTPDCTLFNASFLGGINLFPAPASTLNPYVGASGIVGWGLMKLPTPPTGIDENTQSLVYGYELRAGIDWRTNGGKNFRLQSSLYSASGTFAETSGVALNGFRIGLTLGF